MSDFRDTEGTGAGLRQYLEVLRRRKLIVISVLALALGAASALTLATTSLYEAQTTIVVGQGTCIVNPQNSNAIQPFSQTATELIQSNIVAREVIKDLHLTMTPQALLGSVSVSFNSESAAVKASVVNHDPQLARKIADRLGVNFARHVPQRLGKGTSTTPPLRACKPPAAEPTSSQETLPTSKPKAPRRR